MLALHTSHWKHFCKRHIEIVGNNGFIYGNKVKRVHIWATSTFVIDEPFRRQHLQKCVYRMICTSGPQVFLFFFFKSSEQWRRKKKVRHEHAGQTCSTSCKHTMLLETLILVSVFLWSSGCMGVSCYFWPCLVNVKEAHVCFVKGQQDCDFWSRAA